MTKIKIVYKDNSYMDITLKKAVENNYQQYINKYVTNIGRVKSITVQKYPKKDNEPINWLYTPEAKERQELENKTSFLINSVLQDLELSET
jgi:hypothetical protein